MISIGNLRKGYKNPPGKQIRVDRDSPVGNPFYMADESKRDEVCEKYKTYFYETILGANAPGSYSPRAARAENYLSMLLEEAKKGDIVLMCWCAPKRCHAETIKEWLEERIKCDELAKTI